MNVLPCLLMERHERNGEAASAGTLLYETTCDFLTEAKLDRDGGLVRNVALLGTASRNGYRYAAEAMRQATPLYEGRPVFVDHAESGERGGVSPPVRKLRDYAGKVLNPRFENERIRGDLHLLGPNAGWLMSLIEAAPADIGMSHVVLARRGEKGTEVEHIERVVSVDIVAFPATTRSFQESSVGGLSEAGYRELVETSALPPRARTEALYQLLQTCPDPKRLIELLEDYWRHELSETPRSQEKAASEPSDQPALVKYRQQLLFALRGE